MQVAPIRATVVAPNRVGKLKLTEAMPRFRKFTVFLPPSQRHLYY